MKSLLRCFCCALLLFTHSVWAWDRIGHKVIAHIAYDHLSANAKSAVDHLTHQAGSSYPPRSRFVFIAPWADWARAHGDTRFRRWHYINLPLRVDGHRAQKASQHNVVYGINRCRATLKAKKLSLAEHQLALKLLVHLVGDIHQPLHDVSQFSYRHPRGDHGGVSYHIHSRTADNLHTYWDRGLGEFTRYHARTRDQGMKIHRYAERIEQRYPEKVFVNKRLTTKPMQWALEGHDLAKYFVYHVKEDGTPSREYRKQGIKIMEQRLAIAGYRLATMLNDIYKEGNHSA